MAQTQTAKARPKKKKKPATNGKAGQTKTKPEAFGLNGALSRMTALCGQVELRCVIAAQPKAFFASAWVGAEFCVGEGKTAGGAIKALWDTICEIRDIDVKADG